MGGAGKRASLPEAAAIPNVVRNAEEKDVKVLVVNLAITAAASAAAVEDAGKVMEATETVDPGRTERIAT